MIWPKSPFWDYSLRLYGRPGVEAACLALQRRHGVDVNLVLFACWLASLGIELDQVTLARAKKTVSDWQLEVIRPLRALRRRLRVRLDHGDPDTIASLWPDQAEALRRHVLATELDGEHLAQLALAQVSVDLKPTRPASTSLASVNLTRYWSFRSNDLHDLRTLLHQAFPEATPENLASALSSIEASDPDL